MPSDWACIRLGVLEGEALELVGAGADALRPSPADPDRVV